MKKLTTEEFIEKAKAVHGDKYDYSKTIYINRRTKVCIICPKHGEFWQTANNHLNKNGCPVCSGHERRDTEKFIKDAQKIHGNKYDYSKIKFIDLKTKVCIICPKHGEFWQTAVKHLKGCGCPVCINKQGDTVSFIEKAKAVHGDKYDYSKANYKKNSIKVCIICPKHGEFWQTPANHLNGGGCPKCNGNAKLTTEEFIEKAKAVHGDKYDYSKANYKNYTTPVCIICPKHGEFWQKPVGHLRGTGCPNCKKSKGEKSIEEFLIKNNIEYIYNHTLKGLSNFRPDFYLPNYNLIIEFDGEQHFKPIKFFGGKKEFNKVHKYDLEKEKLCEENNIDIIRIPYWNLKNINKILSKRLLSG